MILSGFQGPWTSVQVHSQKCSFCVFLQALPIIPDQLGHKVWLIQYVGSLTLSLCLSLQGERETVCGAEAHSVSPAGSGGSWAAPAVPVDHPREDQEAQGPFISVFWSFHSSFFSWQFFLPVRASLLLTHADEKVMSNCFLSVMPYGPSRQHATLQMCLSFPVRGGQWAERALPRLTRTRIAGQVKLGCTLCSNSFPGLIFLMLLLSS